MQSNPSSVPIASRSVSMTAPLLAVFVKVMELSMTSFGLNTARFGSLFLFRIRCNSLSATTHFCLFALGVGQHEQMIAESGRIHHGSAHLFKLILINYTFYLIEPNNILTLNIQCISFLLSRVDDIRIANRADFEWFVSHIQHLRDGHRGLSISFG